MTTNQLATEPTLADTTRAGLHRVFSSPDSVRTKASRVFVNLVLPLRAIARTGAAIAVAAAPLPQSIADVPMSMDTPVEIEHTEYVEVQSTIASTLEGSAETQIAIIRRVDTALTEAVAAQERGDLAALRIHVRSAVVAMEDLFDWTEFVLEGVRAAEEGVNRMVQEAKALPPSIDPDVLERMEDWLKAISAPNPFEPSLFDSTARDQTLVDGRDSIRHVHAAMKFHRNRVGGLSLRPRTYGDLIDLQNHVIAWRDYIEAVQDYVGDLTDSVSAITGEAATQVANRLPMATFNETAKNTAKLAEGTALQGTRDADRAAMNRATEELEQQ